MQISSETIFQNGRIFATMNFGGRSIVAKAITLIIIINNNNNNNNVTLLCRSRTLMGIDGLHCCTTAGYWATVKLSQRSTILALSSSRRIETVSVRPHRLQMIEEGWKLVILGFRRVKPSRRSLSVRSGLVGRNRVCDQPSAVIPVRSKDLGFWARIRVQDHPSVDWTISQWIEWGTGLRSFNLAMQATFVTSRTFSLVVQPSSRKLHPMIQPLESY